MINHIHNLTAEWRAISPTLRHLCVILLISGMGLLSVGVLGDTEGWWSQAPFLTNVASSITGACFGIPLALLILQRLSTVQSSKAQMASSFRVAHTLLDEVHTTTETLHPQETSFVAIKKLLSILTKHGQEAHKFFTEAINGRDDAETLAGLNKTLSDISSTLLTLQAQPIPKEHEVKIGVERIHTGWKLFQLVYGEIKTRYDRNPNSPLVGLDHIVAQANIVIEQLDAHDISWLSMPYKPHFRSPKFRRTKPSPKRTLY